MEFLFPALVLALLAILAALGISAGRMVAAPPDPRERSNIRLEEDKTWTEEVDRFDRILSAERRDPGFDGTK